MALRTLTRGLFQLAMNRSFYSSIQKPVLNNIRLKPFRAFSSIQTINDAYKDLSRYLEKEIQLEKSAQKHPSKLPTITGFEVSLEIVS